MREAQIADIPQIASLTKRAYKGFPPYTHKELRGQINNFPDGVFVAVMDEKVVGYCASLRITEKFALRRHNWEEITGNGLGSRHMPTGDWLYGYEMCVDPVQRGVRIGGAYMMRGGHWPSGWICAE